ncbi:unnamed protein product, partial [Vitis vinifera]
MKSSCRSFKQISRWSSPAPAMMCSPDSSILQTTIGSDLAKRFKPSTSLGRSDATLHCTATRTTVSCLFPIQITVLCTLLTYRSFFSPGT